MKNILYSLLGLIIITSFNSCEDYDPAVTPPSSLSFVGDDVTVNFLPDEPVYPLTVYATQTSNQARTVNLNILEGDNPVTGEPYDTSLPTDYEISSTTVTIPAGELSGSVNITFDSDMALGETRWVSFEIPESEGYVTNNASSIITVSYSPACPYNSVVVDITTDPWGSETTWEITNSTGSIVASGGPYADLSSNTTAVQPSVLLCFEDGTYTFTIYDSYGDGMTYTNGGVTSTGAFKVSTEDGDVLVQGAGNSFTTSATFEFSLPL